MCRSDTASCFSFLMNSAGSPFTKDTSMLY